MRPLHGAKALIPFVLHIHHALLLVLRAKPARRAAWNIETRNMHAAKVLTSSILNVHYALLLVL